MPDNIAIVTAKLDFIAMSNTYASHATRTAKLVMLLL